MPPLAQPVVLDLLSLAVGKTALKEQLSLDEFRTQISAQYDALVSGERLKLQVVWNLFAPHTGFDPKVAACPMCWVKQLESRIGVPVDLPTDLSTLKSSDVATNAAKVFVRREEIDKVLGPDTGSKARATTPLPVSYARAAVAAPPPSAIFETVVEPGAPPAIEPGAPPALDPPPLELLDPAPSLTRQVATMAARSAPRPEQVSARQRMFALIAAGSLVLSVAVIGLTLRGSCAKAPTNLELRTADLPLTRGQQFGRDASFVLSDLAWLTTPLAERQAALEALLDELHGDGIDNVALVDADGKLRASVQWTGAEARVRFY